MEWIVTTGPSIEAAKEAALDQLGVAEDEAEFEVLEEPKAGLFGRLRREARVRARVLPMQPRPKVERRRNDRGRKREDRPKGERAKSSGGGRSSQKKAEATPQADGTVVAEGEATQGDPAPKKARAKKQSPKKQGPKEAPVTEVVVPLSEHADLTCAFVEGLVDAFGYDADIEVQEIDDETAEVRVDGEGLGLLIGRGGATLQAIQTLARASVQRRRDHSFDGRVFIEVSGYRQQRKAALEQFTNQLIEQVRESGVEKALEPMGSADRKVVHDTVNEAAGVRTISVGEEPRRRVVIMPDND